jgi:hypothetical protein
LLIVIGKPKSTTFFLKIIEKKMLGVETTPLPGHQIAFVKVGARFPRPQTMNIE